jgi:hypothetical protein
MSRASAAPSTGASRHSPGNRAVVDQRAAAGLAINGLPAFSATWAAASVTS